MMKRLNVTWVIFIVGLFPLAFLMEWYKANIGDDWWRVLIAIAYLILLRLAGDLVASKLE